MNWAVNATRKEYPALSKEQLQTCANNGLADFGYQNRGWIAKMRNNVGTMECSADLSDKNAMTALYDQFITYPAVVADSLKNLPEQDRQIYSRVICKAMNCHQDIKKVNATMVNAARMTILAAGTIATGGAAELVIIGVGATVEVANGVQKTADLNHEKDALLKGVSNGGYPSAAWINDTVREIGNEKKAVVAEAVLAVALEALPAAKVLKHLKTGGHLAEEALATEAISAPATQNIISKLIVRIPPKYREAAVKKLEVRIKESFKEAFSEFAKFDHNLVDSNGNPTPRGAKIFAGKFVQKFTGNLIAFDVATERKLHLGPKDEDYLRLVNDAMDTYAQDFQTSAPNLANQSDL
ncbi:MAG: hypothetical protein EBX52_02790 [Proteobacteria bacterium]|nr:hypothetical protein [Pseudomonadota bacterium]